MWWVLADERNGYCVTSVEKKKEKGRSRSNLCEQTSSGKKNMFGEGGGINISTYTGKVKSDRNKGQVEPEGEQKRAGE